ncbi:MFS transporter [Ornithinimicrobium sufpigmenti]|uniref:MFS transporter n=1 Tax=Ornithinimicrobium sufpigmenti TaxID=2508882 RepID=UPI001036EAB7
MTSGTTKPEGGAAGSVDLTAQAPVGGPPEVVDRDTPEFRTKGRRALGAAMFGFWVDMYDIYLPVIVLAPAMVYFMPPETSGVDAAVFLTLIYVASIVGRPLGSLIFGPLGDTLGRRKTTLIAAGGSSVATGLMTFLPGYTTLGIWALVALLVLRLFDGIFLGGEYTAANPLAMEYTRKERRGVAGSLINTGYPLALATITVVTIITMRFFPVGDAASAYAVWGWRIPFFIGFVLCTSLFFYYLLAVPESEIWTKMPKNSGGNPLKILFSGSNIKSFGVAFVVGTGAWLTLNGSVGMFAGHFRRLEVSDGTINTVILVAALSGALLFPLVGAAGQRFGRRQVIMAIGVLILLFGSVGMALAVRFVETNMFVVLAVIGLIPGLLIWAMITAFLMELFPTNVRASGYGVAYSLPSIIPALYGYYMVWLGNVMDYDYTPIVIGSLGAICLIIGGYIAKDVRHVDLEHI